MFGLRHANSPVHVMDFIVKTAVKIHSEALLQIFLELGFIFKLPVSRLIIHVDTSQSSRCFNVDFTCNQTFLESYLY